MFLAYNLHFNISPKPGSIYDLHFNISPKAGSIYDLHFNISPKPGSIYEGSHLTPQSEVPEYPMRKVRSAGELRPQSGDAVVV